ncbi:PEP-CTERM sorting domain-containing protein [Calothrix sp. CCY 0018]|uniref:PEP-CTERM sorting domain-containing protein n=1 Tax=Calothrix sp. CCY 0018 TaxID=3103864 RepID=UPI0039C6A4DA
MFSNIFQKAALFGASTVAGVALTGTMMANSAQAATMSYTSEFSITSNSLKTEVATGKFSFTKTEKTGADSGLFSYKLTDFNSSFGALGFSKSLSLNDVKANPNPFLAVNQAFVPDKYQNILPSVLAGDNSNYVGDGDFPPDDFIKEFTAQEFSGIADEYNLSSLISAFLPSVNAQQAEGLFNIAFNQGGKVSLTTTSKSVPEPTTIFGIGVVGIGLVATRRKRASKKIKQKAAA